ncbi:hypothetical protein GCM10027275_03670 [Rhabdobacter roseus]
MRTQRHTEWIKKPVFLYTFDRYVANKARQGLYRNYLPVDGVGKLQLVELIQHFLVQMREQDFLMA